MKNLIIAVALLGSMAAHGANILIQSGVGMTPERLAVFEEAADQWEAILNPSVDIVVAAPAFLSLLP